MCCISSVTSPTSRIQAGSVQNTYPTRPFMTIDVQIKIHLSKGIWSLPIPGIITIIQLLQLLPDLGLGAT